MTEQELKAIEELTTIGCTCQSHEEHVDPSCAEELTDAIKLMVAEIRRLTGGTVPDEAE